MEIPKPEEKISKYFTWKEALWLPSENRMAEDTDGVTPKVLENLTILFQKMDMVREYFGKPISVTLCFRSMAYHLGLYERINAKRVAQGIDPLRVPMKSAHLYGMACDFVVKGMKCEDVRQMILKNDKLNAWNMRMENNGKDANWIHLDLYPPGPSGRFFNLA